MADKRTTPDAHGGHHRRKREAPTIDLTAEEVKPAPAATSAEVEADAPQAAAHVPPASEPVMSTPESEAEPASTANVEMSPPPEAEPAIAETGHQETPQAAERTADDRDRRPQAALLAPMLAGGAAGAALAAAILLALWLTDTLPANQVAGADNSAQIAALEKQVRDLQNRPVPTASPALDSEAIDALTERVGRIETIIARLPAGESGLTERVGAADNALKSLGVALTALNKRGDDVATEAAAAQARAEAAEKAVAELRASLQDVAKNAAAGVSPLDLDTVQKRVAALEQSAKDVRGEIAKTAAADNAARLALGAAALRDAVLGGAPFAAELAQVKALGAPVAAVAPLEPFAAAGVPSAVVLAGELRAVLPAMQKLSGPPTPTGGFLERLEANASRLVRVRPVDAPAGDDAAALLARLERAADKANIAAALADLAKLDAATRAPAQAWIDKARARQAALAAANALAADAARSLGKS